MRWFEKAALLGIRYAAVMAREITTVRPLTAADIVRVLREMRGRPGARR